MTVAAVAERGGLASRWKHLAEKDAETIAREEFGVVGTATRFATEKDDTFRIRTSQGTAYVLKVANPDEDVEELHFQIGLLNHIAERAPAIPIPRVRSVAPGRFLTEIAAQDGRVRQARMLTFMEGTPLDQVSTIAIQRFRVGEVLARLRLASADFSHPADSRVLPWDVRHLLDLEGLLQGIADAERRKKLNAAMARFADIVPQIARTRFQVLHNDFSRSNIVVDSTRDAFVTGIIDFGDSVRTSVAIDVATALLNQLPSEPKQDLFAEGRDVLGGYLSITELSDLELALVPHLVMGRVVARALLTTWRASIMPENAQYIMRNTEQGWRQLEWFLDRSVDEVTETFLR